MPAGFGVVPGDEVAFDPGDGHLERLPDLRNDPPPDPGANRSNQMRIGQGEIAPALPAVVETLDRPSVRILHEAAFPAAAALEAVDEMAAKLRLENVGKREDWRRRPIADGLAPRRRPIQPSEHPLVLIQRSNIDDPEHPIEDDPGSGDPKGLGEALAVPQEPDRRISRLERAPRSRVRNRGRQRRRRLYRLRRCAHGPREPGAQHPSTDRRPSRIRPTRSCGRETN